MSASLFYLNAQDVERVVRIKLCVVLYNEYEIDDSQPFHRTPASKELNCAFKMAMTELRLLTQDG